MTLSTPRRTYRYFDLVMVAFVVVLLCSNLIGVSKVTTLFGFTFGSAIFFFPFSYVFGDILTEVYGYAHSRRAVWAGISALLFASLMSWIVLSMPPAPDWPHQKAYETVLGSTPRIVFASLTAYFCGEFANSLVLAKMKVAMQGRKLWARTIGSTIVGEGIDSLLFYPLAFYGSWDNAMLIKVLLTNYALKVIWEALMTPFTYKIVGFLKRAENEDYYDRDTDFTPFSLKT